VKKIKLKNWPNEPPATGKGIQILAEAASVFFKIPLTELRSRKRTNEIVWPRAVCMWIARDANYTSQTVGKWWHRDHGTVLHAVKLVNNLIETYPKYNDQFKKFKTFAKEYLKKHL